MLVTDTTPQVCSWQKYTESGILLTSNEDKDAGLSTKGEDSKAYYEMAMEESRKLLERSKEQWRNKK